MKQDLESKDELAKNRLQELEKLQEAHQKLVSEHEKLKQQVSYLTQGRSYSRVSET